MQGIDHFPLFQGIDHLDFRPDKFGNQDIVGMVSAQVTFVFTYQHWTALESIMIRTRWSPSRQQFTPSMPREWSRNGCYRLTLQPRTGDDYDGGGDNDSNDDELMMMVMMIVMMIMMITDLKGFL